MVSTKGSDQFRAKDAKGFKYVLYGKNIYTSRSFGKKQIYKWQEVPQGTEADPCHIEPRDVKKTPGTYVAMINGNDKCTENDKNFSDSTYLQNLNYDLVVFVGNIDKKLDVTKSTSRVLGAASTCD